MEIITGKIKKAKKVVIYGPEGIGKSTFASKFPQPLFIDTEGSTTDMDVARTPKATSWTMLKQQVNEIKSKKLCKTLIVDTIDWAEQMCIEDILARYQKNGIEDFGYGNGYVYVKEEFGRFLNQLQDVVDSGINVVLTAHSQMRKFEQPDEMGAYDRYELKLGKKTQSQTSPLVKEWADALLFCNYKTYSVAEDDKGKKHKAQGGKRVMYTSHHPCWDAKNRWDLPNEVDFDYSAIAHCIPSGTDIPDTYHPEPIKQSEPEKTVPVADPPKQEEKDPIKGKINPPEPPKGLPKALTDLMAANKVTVEEIQKAVASRGYYPEDTPVENYDPSFISGCLVGAWNGVFGMIKDIRIKSGQFVPADPDEIPFN